MSRFAFFGACVDRCESPIEHDFLVALLFSRRYTFDPLDEAPLIARDATGVVLGQQIPVGPYRVDFTLTRPGARARLAVELDGYMHHGATPEQFERDAARQRYLTRAGWTVLRFSGREIARGAVRCADDAMAHAAALVDAATAPGAGARVALRATPGDPEMAEIARAVADAEAAGAPWEEKLRLLARAGERARARAGLTRTGAA